VVAGNDKAAKLSTAGDLDSVFRRRTSYFNSMGTRTSMRFIPMMRLTD
jgi:hypothetical protein